MKNWILFLSLAICILVSGCCTHSRSKSYWIKDGKEVPSGEVQKDYQECRGPNWIKDGITIDEAKKDYDFCTNASIAREKHQRVAVNALSLGALIPFVNIATGVAMIAVEAGGSLSVQRCMESKGYIPAPQKENAEQCMKDKGYEWVEEK